MDIKQLIKDFSVAVGAESQQEEMALIKGFITLSSAIIPGVMFKDRDHRQTRANLFYAVIANAGSNKSRLGKLEKLVMPIHREIRDDENALRASFDKTEKALPRKNVLLSGNITRARVIEHLSANKEVPLVIIDSEMDSITTSMQVDHGGFRAELRKAYHGEFIGSSKKTDDELLEAVFPHMSILVTGTFDQSVKYLSPVSDGFASRHLFDVNLKPSSFTPYGVPGSKSPESTMDLWAKHFHKLWQFFNERTVQVNFTDMQVQHLNELGKEWERDIKQNMEDNSLDFFFRHLLMALKTATTLTAWRAYFLDDYASSIICKDVDFDFALEIIRDSYRHLQDLYGVLPLNKEMRVVLSSGEIVLLTQLDDTFSTADAYEAGMRAGLSERRIREYLKKYVVTGAIQRLSKGQYLKR